MKSSIRESAPKASLEDVLLVRNEKQSVVVYICQNKRGEIHFIVSDDKGDYHVAVWGVNPALLKRVIHQL